MNHGLQPYQLEPRRRRRRRRDVEEIEGLDNIVAHEGEDIEWRKVNKEEWCQCGRCELMDTAVECLCCREIENVRAKMNIGSENEMACILDHFEFEFVCLHPAVIRTALVARTDIRRDSIVDPIPNETFRLQAYRQFTYWVHDRLGKAVRRVIPACVVNKIRKDFPSIDGNYVGFKEVE
ncbi:P2X purinoceptor 7-like [Antedon mediterranea]|uniref:P2X purinoceptor 7-like n=1 Tax=Antedon mediterranea TaxID=105859 RepID=UPI003AF727E6